MRKDHLVSLDVVPADRPSISMHLLTLLERIRVAHGRGEDRVRLQFSYDFDIQVDRRVAERLRDDLARWLEEYPAPRKTASRRIAGRKQR